jgi:8-oxo-dGTP pyrophosphatase MutT (NUDIX family)
VTLATLDLPTLRTRLRDTLAGRARRVAEPGERLPAAVLLLIVYRDGEPHLVFTKKTETVPHHKGQFAFPGGLVEARDASRVETALREAREEVGLDPAAVEVLGVMDDVREIERVFEVPLRLLAEPGAFREEWWEREGRSHPVAFFTAGEDVIWGATARILKEFLELLRR